MRVECPFSSSCYRRNPHHFREYLHQHLSRILSEYPNLNLPSDIQLPSGVSMDVMKQQLKLYKDVEKQLGSVNGNTENNTKQSNSNGEKTNSNIKIKDTEVSTPDKIKVTKVNTGDGMWPCTNCTFLNEGIEAVCGMCDAQKGSNTSFGSSKRQRSSSPSDLNGTSDTQGKEKRQSKDIGGETVRSSSPRNPKGKSKIQAKLEAAYPYNFLLTKVKDCPESHTDSYSVFLADLLHPSLGALASSLQINFMVELDWLMMSYELTKNQDKPLVILYGMESPELGSSSLPSNIRAVRVKPKYPYGTHHTKMMILLYTDGSLRVVVTTANLVGSDWENRTQGLWVSPSCPKLTDQSTGESDSGFKSSLIRYLKFYEVTPLHQFISAVQSCDMSSINVAFVASVPDSHKDGAMCLWGHRALAKLLRQNMTANVKEGGEWPVTVQCSSIGSLGQGPDAWFERELGGSLSSRKGVMGGVSGGGMHLVYPSHNDVLSSYDGPLGGGCLPYSGRTAAKQPWLEQFCHHWKAEASFRSRAMPHIKTYTRTSPDHKRMAYFCLTSANLSKAAWGSVSKAGNSCLIMSYEAGVVWLPKFCGLSSDSFETVPFKQRETASPKFPLHYDLPLTKYRAGETPWLMDYLM